MDDKDKKEIAKIMGEVLEQNVLPVIDELKQDLYNTKKELKEDINDLYLQSDRVERVLTKAIERYDYKLDNHENRISVLEGKKAK